MQKTNKLAILSFALASALAAPAAFAQSAPTTTTQDPAAQSMPQQQPAEAAPQAAAQRR